MYKYRKYVPFYRPLDVNRYNFLFGLDGTILRMVDFEHVEDFDEGSAREELLALPVELAEGSGRGGPARYIM
jgi:hypothetical protein